MDIIVLLKQVPDLVEELQIDASGAALDREWLRFRLNEFDDHALEQALLLKESHGGRVTVLALDAGDVEDTLFTALAKGADAALKIVGASEGGVSSHAASEIFKAVIGDRPRDLVLTGVGAIDDLDGQVGPILACAMNVPYVGVVSAVEMGEGGRSAVVRKEHPGGIFSEIAVTLPAVLGIQAAAKPPRYVPIAKIRQAMKSSTIEEVPAPGEGAPPGAPGLRVRRMFMPEAGGHAEMISGSPAEIASKVAAILVEKGVLR